MLKTESETIDLPVMEQKHLQYLKENTDTEEQLYREIFIYGYAQGCRAAEELARKRAAGIMESTLRETKI